MLTVSGALGQTHLGEGHYSSPSNHWAMQIEIPSPLPMGEVTNKHYGERCASPEQSHASPEQLHGCDGWCHRWVQAKGSYPDVVG